MASASFLFSLVRDRRRRQSGGQAAIYADVLAGDEACARAGPEYHDLSDFTGPRDVAKWVRLPQPLMGR
jgi:hypothetical protein